VAALVGERVEAEDVAVGIAGVEPVDGSVDALDRADVDAEGGDALVLCGDVVDAEADDDRVVVCVRVLEELDPDAADLVLGDALGGLEVRLDTLEHRAVPEAGGLQVGDGQPHGHARDVHAPSWSVGARRVEG
jgi:hypothetical protein